MGGDAIRVKKPFLTDSVPECQIMLMPEWDDLVIKSIHADPGFLSVNRLNHPWEKNNCIAFARFHLIQIYSKRLRDWKSMDLDVFDEVDEGGLLQEANQLHNESYTELNLFKNEAPPETKELDLNIEETY